MLHLLFVCLFHLARVVFGGPQRGFAQHIGASEAMCSPFNLSSIQRGVQVDGMLSNEALA